MINILKKENRSQGDSPVLVVRAGFPERVAFKQMGEEEGMSGMWWARRGGFSP